MFKLTKTFENRNWLAITDLFRPQIHSQSSAVQSSLDQAVVDNLVDFFESKWQPILEENCRSGRSWTMGNFRLMHILLKKKTSNENDLQSIGHCPIRSPTPKHQSDPFFKKDQKPVHFMWTEFKIFYLEVSKMSYLELEAGSNRKLGL